MNNLAFHTLISPICNGANIRNIYIEIDLFEKKETKIRGKPTSSFARFIADWQAR